MFSNCFFQCRDDSFYRISREWKDKESYKRLNEIAISIWNTLNGFINQSLNSSKRFLNSDSWITFSSVFFSIVTCRDKYKCQLSHYKSLSPHCHMCHWSPWYNDKHVRNARRAAAYKPLSGLRDTLVTQQHLQITGKNAQCNKVMVNASLQ